MNMAAKSIHKVVRLQLAWLYDEQNHFRYPYQKLHDLQQMVNQVKNRTIQAFWEWSNMEVAFKRKQDSIPSYKEYTDGMSMDGYIYRILKEEYPQMYSANLSCSIRCAGKAFRNAKAAMLRGEQSVISYRADAPIELHNGHICLYQEKQRYYVSLHLFSKAFAKEQNFPGTAIDFELYRLGGSQRAIVDRCISGEYKIGESELIYNKKKRCWFLNLTYEFIAEASPALDPSRIMGVDLGIQCVAYMGFNFCEDRFSIGRSEVDAFRQKTEARKRALQRQGKACGDGRIGHGYSTRNKPVLQISDAVSRFRDTANHKYSRYIVQKAVQMGCGTIQMEDLKDFHSAVENKFLKDWTYFDLRQKVKYKAEEYGIEVKLVNPRYTSQRCSKCGHIDRQNRPKEEKGQAYFQCVRCGYTDNADYNASVNLATPNIDQIIANDLGAKD